MELRHMDTTARILIAASRERVWGALTGEVSAWWGAPYLLLDDAPAAETFSLIAEPRVGAPVLETLGDQQAMWGVVNIVAPPSEFGWVGQMGMGGATNGEVRFTLEADDDATLVTVRHRAIGYFGDAIERSYDYGWNDLLHRLSAHVVEGRNYGAAGLNRAP